ncbi:MAG: LytR family transcriptional regulator [Bacillales bacterium]|jgi:LCP family protein required for cell wall assembly|nr:LytR family transcriptional regulator [Bacillales bacterium]
MSSDKSSKKKMGKKLKIALVIVGVLMLITGGYALSVYLKVKSTTDIMYMENFQNPKSEYREEKVDLKKAKPFSILILGVDQRKNDRGRSDTMIVMTINPNTDSIKMLSIPRDTRVPIRGHNLDKINHSYAFGKEELAIETVQNFLDIPIDKFVKVNMEGFKDIVSAIGGVEVNSNIAFTNEGHSYVQGLNELNGAEALSYVRMRYDDPQGDFGRQQRQRQLIEAVISKAKNPKILLSFMGAMDAVGNNVRTNISYDEMKLFQKNYGQVTTKIDQISLQKSHGETINKIYYLIPNETEIREIKNLLHEQLEI